MQNYDVSPEAMALINAAREQLKKRDDGALFGSVEARIQTAEAARAHGYYAISVAHYEDAATRAGLLRGEGYLEEAAACARLVDQYQIRR